MATATHAGPINIEQINSTFYVSATATGFGTIQKAVDYVRIHNNGSGIVVVTQGVDAAQSIPAVTGGSTSIFIWDNRAGNTQQWGWDGAKYVPTDFDQAAGYIARGGVGHNPASTTLDYSPSGGAGNGRGDINVIANPGKAMPAIALTCFPSDGTPGRTFFRGDQSPVDGRFRVQVPAALYLTPPDNLFNLWIGQPADINISKGMYIWTKPSENATDLQALTASGIYDQTLRLNFLGGDVAIGPNALVTTAGSVHAKSAVIAGDLTVDGEMQAGTGFVGGSEIVTRANIGELGGMVWPPDGVPVALGDVWGTSIDPADLPRLSAINDFTGDLLVDGSPVITQATLPPSAPYPGAGVAVSSGSAWGTSIDPATIAYRNQNNTFTGQMVIQSADPSKQLLEIVNPTITQGTIKAFDIGKAEAVNKKFFCNFYYDGDSSTFNNYVEYTFWGVSTALFIHPGGACVGSPLRKDAPFCVSGASHLYDKLQVDGLLTLNSNVGNITTPTFSGTILGWNLQSGNGHTDFINLKGGVAGGGFSWYIAAPSTTLTPATVPVMNLDSNGSLLMTGGISLKGGSSLVDGTMRMTFDNPSASAYLDACGSGAARAGLLLRQWAVGATNPIVSLAFDTSGNAAFPANVTVSGNLTATGATNYFASGRLALLNRTVATGFTTPNINSDGQSIVMNGAANQGVYFNLDRIGTTGFGNGAAGVVGSVDSTGKATFTALAVSGAKTFAVLHPLDDTKDLIHACLEGPENGVYYRGEAVVVEGTAVVHLPDYFEALTFEDERSVQLTQISEGSSPMFARMAASRVVDGKFTIYATPDATVAWEVKAVRRIGVERLEVTPAKAEPLEMPTPLPATEETVH